MGRFTCLSLLLACLLSLHHAPVRAQERSFGTLITGNGHGFQLFDRATRRLNTMLEHPYRFVAPENAERTAGTGRRNLMHDAYFGLSVGDERVWLAHERGQTEVSYEAESHVIHGVSRHGALTLHTYYFAPFGYEGNALLSLVRVENTGAEPVSLRLFFKPNLKLGLSGAREAPGDEGEIISWSGAAQPAHAIETGPGGGHALYVPLGGVDHASCGSDAGLYQAMLDTGGVGASHNCSGQAQVMVLGKDLTVAAGTEAWWGAATLFVNDNPQVHNADEFRERRRVSDLLADFRAWLGERTPARIHEDALTEHEAFRTHTEPAGLSADERALWRQSETVLRMAQIREPRQPHRDNFGMVLAALPPGEWHIGWVRYMAYAVAALAATGHVDMARHGIEFFLGADPQTRGFFDAGYLEQSYRVSATRYFGNGKEEGDFNADGPNVETDGWGLVLWAAGMVMHAGCDVAWLDRPTWRGDTVYEGLREVADDIVTNLENDLPRADASIWEVHWARRQVFTFTAAAQIRGLFDFANIAALHGDQATADTMRERAEAMRAQLAKELVHPVDRSLVSHRGVATAEVHADGSTVEALMWSLFEPDDPIYQGTLRNFSRLVTPFGGYQRLEPGLSLTGEGGANNYDAAQWIFLDLRIGQAFRRAGQVAVADQRLDWTTRAAAVNDHLLPELYGRETGRYEGAIPMVGYGAGAWMMTQLEKHGVHPPRPDDDLTHCLGVQPGADAGVGSADDASVDVPPPAHEHDGGASVHADAGVMQSEPPPSSSSCSVGQARSASQVAWCFAVLACLQIVRRRRARRLAD